MLKYLFTISVIFFSLMAYSQTATIYGKITDEKGETLIGANIYEKKKPTSGTISDENGLYELTISARQRTEIVFSYTGHSSKIIRVEKLATGERKYLLVQLVAKTEEISGATVTGERIIEEKGMIREGAENLRVIPNSSGSVESMLPGIGLGVTAGQGGGALSSQYSVRGGNYDENLVYVNDFEVYRPQLIRAGQQEGLTFPNLDLIRDLSFSSGGFETRYGDKMSSVLDIRYKRPTDFKASVEGSLLGSSFHLEGSQKLKSDTSGYRRFRYLLGTRYKTTRYLLGSLDTEGEYTPNFVDVQGYFTYDISKEWNMGLLANFNRSQYNFVPRSRSTAFGLWDYALELNSVFQGQEKDDFTTYMGGISLSYVPENRKHPLYMKFLASTYQSNENERIDILGNYLIGQVNTDLGSNDFGEIVSVLGTGTQHQFVRNYLTSNVTNAEYKGGWEYTKEKGASYNLNPNENAAKVVNSHFLQWGVKYQNEIINDKLNEWERLDSAGYSLPYSNENVLLYNVLKTENNLSSNRFSAYIQDTWHHSKDSMNLSLSYGIRTQYWDMNKEFIFSPRVQLLYQPRPSMGFRFATGYYHQPAFYRELRRPNGLVNRNVKAQKSLHAVLGYHTDWNWSGVPVKFISEIYYKKMWDLVSYELDNVRIRYAGENNATGYVAGIDLRLNGEFVSGQESWVNLSFLQAREKLNGVQHYKFEVGSTDTTYVNYVPRPTDQFMFLSVFFQDHLPQNPNYKVHMNLTVGTGWPFGIPNKNIEPRNTYRFSTYHRVDIGFSFKLWSQEWKTRRPRHPLRFTKHTWLSLEAFNLMKVSNQASNTWIKTIYGTQFAVPNYLTSRRINLRLRMEF